MAYIFKMNRFIILRDIPKQGPKEVLPYHSFDVHVIETQDHML